MFEVMLSGNVSTVLGDTLVVLISMTLLLFLVKFFAWDKVNAMLEARREKIAKDLDEAAEKENQLKKSKPMRMKLFITQRKKVEKS